MQDNTNNIEEVNEVSTQEPTEVTPVTDVTEESSTPEETVVESYVSQVQTNVDNIEDPVTPYEVTALIDGSSFSTVTTSARTVQDFVKEQGLDPEQTEVQNSSNQFMSMGDSMDPDDVYSLIARNKTGG
jgi:hypothetical protein